MYLGYDSERFFLRGVIAKGASFLAGGNVLLSTVIWAAAGFIVLAGITGWGETMAQLPRNSVQGVSDEDDGKAHADPHSVWVDA